MKHPGRDTGRTLLGAPASTGRRLFEAALRGPDGAALRALAAPQREALAVLLAEVDRALERGHTLVDERDPPPAQVERAEGDAGEEGAVDAPTWRLAFDAAEALAAAAASSAVDPPGTVRLIVRLPSPVWDEPIAAAYVLRGEPGSRRLSTARSADDERRTAKALVARITRGAAAGSAGADVVDDVPGATPEQARAVSRATREALLLLTGGPGTGKTRTIARIVAARLAAAKRGSSSRILVTAPTGRAAARLREQLGEELASPGASGFDIAKDVSTIHAALGWQPVPGSPFRHAGEHPLPADLVIVDECSMVDLALMRRLVEATSKEAALVLVGDADQLASVEAGSVFADLCAAPQLADSLVRLAVNHRSAGNPRAAWLAELAEAVRCGDADRAVELLRREEALIEPPGAGGGAGAASSPASVGRPRTGALTHLAVDLALPEYERLLDESLGTSAADPLKAFDALRRFRVLAATRRGDGGVEPIAAQLDARLVRDRRGTGRHLIILENDRDAELANGDMGVVVPGGVVVGRRTDGSPRVLPEASLPAHEPAWAISIHKSQGSEFERVLVVLPAEASPILSRQLLYTALTRSRGEVRVVASEASVRRAVSASIRRAGGLADAIGAATGGPAAGS